MSVCRAAWDRLEKDSNGALVVYASGRGTNNGQIAQTVSQGDL